MPTPPALLTDRVVLVTGASGTIGGGVVEQVLAAGGRVVRHHHRGPLPPAGEGIVADLAQDLTEPGGPAGLWQRAVDAAGGRVDGLVNVAGIQPVVGLADMREEEWRAMLEANLTATHLLSTAAAADMAEGGGGAIVHLASIEGHRPAAGHAHYAVSKAGLLMHARAMGLEHGPAGVRVNTVSPGLIDRPGLAEDWPDGHDRWLSAAPLGRLGQPSDVGAACVFLLSDAAGWISGTDVVVDGGMSARPSW